MSMSRMVAFLCSGLIFAAPAHAQKFLHDDPIVEDRDQLPIDMPAVQEVSPSYDAIENLFGGKGAEALVSATNVNTLGEVPDSTWFTNRIGVREMTISEIVQGGDTTAGPDTSGILTIEFAGLGVIGEGLAVRDRRHRLYYIKFDPTGLANLPSGADMITSKFLHAIGYNVFSASLAYVDAESLRIAPGAYIRRLGDTSRVVTEEFVRILLEGAERGRDGLYRVSANEIPPGEYVGKFRYYGTRSDDPNDLFAHENRRELRALRVFAAWLNHTNCNAATTIDFYEGGDDGGFLRHYLVDFSTSLGSGWDIESGRMIPKELRAGNEYLYWDNTSASIKTAASLGLWERSWMKITYPYPKYSEVGRIEADFFEPQAWKPNYPNVAFDQMLPEDAFWAAKILARFSNQAIRAVVATAQYADAEAESFLAETLIRRKEKILDYYFRQVNPLDEFSLDGHTMSFVHLGEKQGIGKGSSYAYEWFSFDNNTGKTVPIDERVETESARIPLPVVSSDYLMVAIETLDDEVPQWQQHVRVFVRMNPVPAVVGIERDGVAR